MGSIDRFRVGGVVFNTVGAYVGIGVGINVRKCVGKDVGLLVGANDFKMDIVGTTSVWLTALTLILPLAGDLIQ